MPPGRWLTVPGPGPVTKAAPFALVAVAAEASLALPPGTSAWTAVTVSLVLLAAAGLAFLLPWDRLPAWLSVLVPLVYTGSALALTLAGGTISGVGLVVLIPLFWTALFHRRWESACVVAAIVAAEIIISVAQSAPDAVIVRRVLLWGALGSLLAVATHGLRDRIRRSSRRPPGCRNGSASSWSYRTGTALAADLQSSVVQRIFATGLNLQGVLAMVRPAEVRRRVEASVDDLDETIRLLRPGDLRPGEPAGPARACSSRYCGSALTYRRYPRSPSPGRWTLPCRPRPATGCSTCCA